MADPIVQLPLDTSGRDPNNLVNSEAHTLTAITGFAYKMISLVHGGFYVDSLRVYDANYKRLVIDQDYIVTYNFKNASQYTGLQVCGGIVFLDKTRSGNVFVSAQMVGGDLAFSFTVVSDYVRFVKTLASGYVPVSFDYDGNEPIWAPGELAKERWHLDTYQPFNNEIDRVKRAIAGDIGKHEDEFRASINDRYQKFLALFNKNLENHIKDTANPHGDLKDQVGLGRVQNFRLATQAELNAGISNALYLTPGLVGNFVEQFANSLVNSHINNFANPHRTTASQAGGMTKEEVGSTIAGKYLRDETVANANQLAFNGAMASYPYLVGQARQQLPAGAFVSGGANGFINPQRVGRGNPAWNTLLDQNGNWATLDALLAQQGGSPVGSKVLVMVFGNVTPTAAHQIAISQPWAASAPVGSLIFYALPYPVYWGYGNGQSGFVYNAPYGSMKTAAGWVQL